MLLLFALALAVLLTAAWTAHDWRELVRGRLPGPVDMVRLAQVRDWIGGQPFGDLIQYRVAPPAGMPLGWTRLPDLGPAATTLLFTPLLGPRAEVAATVFWPELLLFLHLLVAGRIAGRLGGLETAPLAIFLAGLAWPAVSWLMPGRIGAPGLLILLAEAAALAALQRRWWLVLLAGAAAVGLWDGAFVSVPALAAGIAAALTVPVLARLLVRLRKQGDSRAKWVALGAACLLAPSLVSLIGPSPAATACTSARAFEQLGRLPTGTVMAPAGPSSYVLGLTAHRVIGAPSVRDMRGNRAVREFFASPPDRARYQAALWTVDYVAFCTGDLDDAAPHSLAAGLRQERAPDWLEPVLIAGGRLRVWRVLPGPLPSR